MATNLLRGHRVFETFCSPFSVWKLKDDIKAEAVSKTLWMNKCDTI